MSQYDNMTFPDYEFREYPKIVTPKKGSPILVNDAAEEAIVMKTGTPPIREAEEVARMVAVAEVKGVLVDKTWSSDKIADVLMDAGVDPTLDPAA